MGFKKGSTRNDNILPAPDTQGQCAAPKPVVAGPKGIKGRNRCAPRFINRLQFIS
ncbi:MAG: hypothetical protein RIQ62_510 [Bacteroidota bacterium]